MWINNKCLCKTIELVRTNYNSRNLMVSLSNHPSTLLRMTIGFCKDTYFLYQTFISQVAT